MLSHHSLIVLSGFAHKGYTMLIIYKKEEQMLKFQQLALLLSCKNL